MTIRTLAFELTFCIAASLHGCSKNEPAVNCTEEFRAVTLLVPGDSLTTAYTVRLSNSDTIRYSQRWGLGGNYYIVLDDNYQPKLSGGVDNFRFIGERAGKVVVKEDYVIKADQCHIHKISGKTEL